MIRPPLMLSISNRSGHRRRRLSCIGPVDLSESRITLGQVAMKLGRVVCIGLFGRAGFFRSSPDEIIDISFHEPPSRL